MSVFLIDNHRRHCSRNQSKEEADDDLSGGIESEQKERSEYSERNESPHHNAHYQPPPNHSAIDLSSSLLSEQMTECKFCEIHEATTDIEEHEMYCGSRTDLCPQCGQRDTVKNLVELSHQCPGQCAQPPLLPPIDTHCPSPLHRRPADSDHVIHPHDHRLATILSADNSDDLQFVDIDAVSHSISNHNGNHNGNHNQNHAANHSLNLDPHSKQETPLLIRAERERLRRTRARNEERDLEFALNLQRELDDQQRQIEAEQAQRLRLQQQEEQRQSAQREEWRRRLLAEQEADRRDRREAQRAFDSLDAAFGANFGDGLGSVMRAEAAEQENLDISNLSYEALEALFPAQAQGAREETLRRLPVEVYRKREGDGASNDERNKCCICLEQFGDGDRVRRLQCLHIFHIEEIDNWLRRNRECPICRINVDEHL